MAIDPTKRIAKWDKKFNVERISAVLTDLRPGMLSSVQSVFPSLTEMEIAVKQTLDAEGVETIRYPNYLAFGREIWSLERRGFSGASLAKEVAVLLTKWVGRGLNLAVLEAIRDEVFNVGPPAGP